jgi:spore coat polysaccharide biosynthesis protein SpsF
MSTDGAVGAFVQARMSSQRFPGKVLAPFRGEPVIAHVVRAVSAVIERDRIVVVTSDTPADDPLAAYIDTLGVHCFRGPHHDVFERFRQCASRQSAEWLLRVSADSPLLDPAILRRVIDAASAEWDLITTIWPRTFPRGQNAELIRTTILLGVPACELTDSDREHVTPFFYRAQSRFRIRSIESGDPQLAERNLAIDTIDDLRRLETSS